MATAALSIGLSMEDILNTEIGLLFGIMNEKNNQYQESKKSQKKEEVVQGTAEMLMRM